MATFTINAGPGTDIWRKPPHTDVFNAPTSAPGSSTTTGPLSSFRSARISFSFEYQEQYDQGGMLLSLRRKDTSSSGSNSSSPPPKWIKTGVEYYHSNPMLSTVACDSWADWSIAPLLQGTGAETGSGGNGKEWTTMAVVREGDEKGISLWVYQIVQGSGEEQKVPLREVCWVFGAEAAEEWEIDVKAMAARPETGTKDDLSVDFRDFKVEWE